MKTKKNPKVDLEKDRGLFFVIGLALVLFMTWRLLEHKTYEKEEFVVEMANVSDELDEEVPITEMLKTPPPPPPPAAPEVIEIVEDEAVVEETIIESTEVSQETVIEEPMEIEDVEVEEIEEDISVPFAVIEDVPIFPGCENAGSKAAQRSCFQKKVQEHILKEFKYPEMALELGIQGKVFVQFIIDSKGRITSIRSRGPDKELQKEAERIIAALPQMTPGKQRGRAVKVPYSIPVTFKLSQ